MYRTKENWLLITRHNLTISCLWSLHLRSSNRVQEDTLTPFLEFAFFRFQAALGRCTSLLNCFVALPSLFLRQCLDHFHATFFQKRTGFWFSDSLLNSSVGMSTSNTCHPGESTDTPFLSPQLIMPNSDPRWIFTAPQASPNHLLLKLYSEKANLNHRLEY